MPRRFPALLLWITLWITAAFAAAPYPAQLFDALQWRLIGPFRGGRVVAVTGVPGDPATFYFGAVGGGVWKTTNAGTSWSPIFDQQRIASIGAIAVAPSNPDIIYVGTGESKIRSQICFGDGVYRSTDAGKTWRNIGLRDTRQISKILIDPRNPNVVYVAALGHPYGPNEERGVFRTTNGGERWERVFFTDANTGAADLAWDPASPRNIYVMMWNARRTVWSQYGPNEGPGSGLWKTTDGGVTWNEIKAWGLPGGQWRRSGIAVAAGGRRVYALIDTAPGAGLYRSDDSGQSWNHVSTDARLTSRSWYFSGVTADPQNPDIVYVPNVGLFRSTDGGISFSVLRGAPGGDDYQIAWVDPTDGRRLIIGTDQGASISLDRGATWSSWYNQPTAQMYHITTDNRFPYTVYGSQQDSGTAAVPSRTDRTEIAARDWFSIGGGESGTIAVDPKNPNIFYAGDTNGKLSRFDRRSGQSQTITPWPSAGGGIRASIAQQKYRFPWTAPLVFSPTDPTALYYGAQYLLKTIDGGLTWKEISPDLTGDTRKNKSSAPDAAVTTENAKSLGYGVIYSIAPSPLQPGVIWAGTDTGLLHITRDGGATWKDVTPKGLSDWSKITSIEASHFDPAVAYAAVDRHRLEDYKPYFYRTADYGQTWKLLTDGLAEPAYLNCIREDPKRKGLLYACTDLDIAVSFDDGGHWQSAKLNLPAVSVRDLVVKGDDLAIATFGRGFWILDNIAPLRQITDAVSETEAFFYKPAPAIRFNPDTFFGTPLPVDEPKAKLPPDGAALDFYFKSVPKDEVSLEIANAAGKVIRRYSTSDPPPPPRRPGTLAEVWLSDPARLTPKVGMNRFIWDLRYPLPEGESERTRAPLVLPGTYTVRLKAGGKTYTQSLIVKLDPRSTATPLELSKQLELSLQCLSAITAAREIDHGVRDVQQQISARRGRAPGNKVAELEHDANQITTANLITQLSTALTVAQSADRTPPAAAYALYQQASAELAKRQAAFKRLKDVDLPELLH